MNLKSELQTMNITDLKGICRELGIKCPTSKSDIIKRLLNPLKQTYKSNKYSSLWWRFDYMNKNNPDIYFKNNLNKRSQKNVWKRAVESRCKTKCRHDKDCVRECVKLQLLS